MPTSQSWRTRAMPGDWLNAFNITQKSFGSGLTVGLELYAYHHTDTSLPQLWRCVIFGFFVS
jgi:hypothetical protein